MKNDAPVHAYRLRSDDHPSTLEMLWEWEEPYVSHLFWHATTYGRLIVPCLFVDWQALAAANQRIWETSYLPHGLFATWANWQAWIPEYRTLIAAVHDVYEAQYGAHTATPPGNPTPSKEQLVMNLIKRLWHWYRDRRLERHALKGRVGGSEPHRSAGTTPIVGIAEDARLRWLMKSGRR